MIGKGAEHGSRLPGSFPVQYKEPGILTVAGWALGDTGFVDLVFIGGEIEVRRDGVCNWLFRHGFLIGVKKSCPVQGGSVCEQRRHRLIFRVLGC
jgi:hypothetical protein